MGIFFVLLFVPMIIQHVSIKGHYIDYEKRNQMALAFFFFLLTIMVMLRHESTGKDTETYILYFKNISKHDWSKLKDYSLEIGYVAFNKLVSLFSHDSRVYLSVAAIVESAMIYPTYRRLNSDTSLTIVLFCAMSTFVMMFSGMRQMLAIGIGFIAYEFTRKGKLIPFIISVFVAMLFHSSAFMLFFMYPVYKAKITKKWLLAVVPIMVLVFVFNRQVFGFLVSLLSTFTRFDDPMSSTGAYTMIFLFSIFAIFAFLIPDEAKLDAETIGLRNFLLLATVLQMFAPLHNLAMRMNYYYIIFIPLLLPKIIECRSERWKQVAIAGRRLMVIFFLAYFFINANRDGNLSVFPYHFFWENIG